MKNSFSDKGRSRKKPGAPRKSSKDKPDAFSPPRKRSAEFDKPRKSSEREFKPRRPGQRPGTKDGKVIRKNRSFNDDKNKPDTNSRFKKPEKKFSGSRNKGRPSPKTPTHKYSNPVQTDGLMRLNKFIANAGICSRREADELIGAGLVSVNGNVVTQMGIKISSSDVVKFHDRVISGEKKQYLVLNKPKDYITTMDDPQERRTVMSLIEDACKERIYPVGRLDRATTGVLLFTNDGDLAKKLTHPSHNIRKIYLVELDKAFRPTDFDTLAEGVDLEDGKAFVDEAGYAGGGIDKKQLIIEIHSGKNRIVRRIFEALGYDVRRLDRVSFAGITKKDLMRGKWRFLSEKEIGYLMMQAGQR